MALKEISPSALNIADGPVTFPSSDGVNAVSLAANTAKDITIPAGANFVRIAGTADFYVKSNNTATVPGDTTDGSASELIKSQSEPEWRHLSGVARLSVISATTCIVTATFFAL